MRPSTSHGRNTRIDNNILSKSLNITSTTYKPPQDDDSWEADMLHEINKPIRPMTAAVQSHSTVINTVNRPNTANVKSSEDHSDSSISIDFDENTNTTNIQQSIQYTTTKPTQQNHSDNSIEIEVDDIPQHDVVRPKTATHNVKQTHTDDNEDVSIEFSDTENMTVPTHTVPVHNTVVHTNTADGLSLDDSNVIDEDIVDETEIVETIPIDTRTDIQPHNNNAIESYESATEYSDDFDKNVILINKPDTDKLYNKTATTTVLPTVKGILKNSGSIDTVITSTDTQSNNIRTDKNNNNENIAKNSNVQTHDEKHTHKQKHKSRRHQRQSSSSSNTSTSSHTSTDSKTSTHSHRHSKHKHRKHKHTKHIQEQPTVYTNQFDTYYQAYHRLQQLSQQSHSPPINTTFSHTATNPIHIQQNNTNEQMKTQLHNILTTLRTARQQLMLETQLHHNYTYSTLAQTQQLIQTLQRPNIAVQHTA